MDDLKKIKDKIQKLLIKSKDKAVTPEEGASFAEKVQELLFKYNLSMDDVDTSEKTEYHIGDPIDKGLIPIWKTSIFAVLCHINFCEGTGTSFKDVKQDYDSYYNGWLSVIGKKSRIELIKYLYRSVTNQIEELANEQFEITNKRAKERASLNRTRSIYSDLFGDLIQKVGSSSFVLAEELNKPIEKEEDIRNWKLSFIYGCVNSVIERLKYSFNKMRDQYNINNKEALVKVNKDSREAEDMLKSLSKGDKIEEKSKLNPNAVLTGTMQSHRVKTDQSSTTIGEGRKLIK